VRLCGWAKKGKELERDGERKREREKEEITLGT